MRTVVLVCAFFASTIGASAQGVPSSSAATDPTEQSPQVAKINVPGSPSFNPDQPVVLSPKLIKKVEPKFTEQARRDKFNAIVGVRMIVDDSGTPRKVQVLVPVGHGLDEAAVNAVRKWRFEPATRGGKPVAVALQAEVSFRIY